MAELCLNDRFFGVIRIRNIRKCHCNFQSKILNNYSVINLFSLIIYFFSIIISFILYCLIPFNPFEIGWSFKQSLFLLIHFLILLLPFTAGSFVIGIQFIKDASISSLYFFNLIGSGAGSIIILIFLNYFHPYFLISMILLFIMPSLILMIFDFIKNKIFFSATAAAMLSLPFFFNMLIISSSSEIFRI